MNKELEEAISVLDKIIKSNNEISNNIDESNEFKKQCIKENKAIETVLQALENSIFKEVIKEKIEEYDKRMEEDKGKPNWVIQDKIVINILQELLEGK